MSAFAFNTLSASSPRQRVARSYLYSSQQGHKILRFSFTDDPDLSALLPDAVRA
uniref:Uncharacterized protein n=1 Tax=Enterobacter cloacae TaxID=550 RepID=A0A2L1KMV6_ENTCL|nr:hypothetical protein [Enterobacter cloacae]